MTPDPSEEPKETILQEADRLINGPRLDSYGDVRPSFTAIGKGWELIIGSPVSAEQVALCMAWLKIVREQASHKRDNLVDICGYVGLAAQLAGDE